MYLVFHYCSFIISLHVGSHTNAAEVLLHPLKKVRIFMHANWPAGLSEHAKIAAERRGCAV